MTDYFSKRILKGKGKKVCTVLYSLQGKSGGGLEDQFLGLPDPSTPREGTDLAGISGGIIFGGVLMAVIGAIKSEVGRK